MFGRRGQFRIGLFATLTSALLLSGSLRAEAQWVKVTNLPPGFVNSMRLLTDGSVMVNANFCSNAVFRLKPSSTGSYVNGTWSSLAPMSMPRFYYASQVLPSGKVWLLGGEYSGSSCTANWTRTGEIYDPVLDTWSAIAPHPEAQFGDDPSMLLNNGKILAGSIGTGHTYLYDIASDTWSSAGSKVYSDRSDEESWALMPDGSVLTYDLFQSIATGGAYAEKYDPVSNTWSSISPSDGSANGSIPQLSSSALGFELGPIVRLQDGRFFVIGATNHTALYDPSTNTWSAGPDMPAGVGADDAPAAVLPNGHVMFLADTGLFNPPSRFFDFDPSANSLTDVSAGFTGAGGSLAHPAFVTRLLMLPNGQVLYNDSSQQLWIFTPPGPVDPLLRPVVTSVVYNGGGVFTLTGKQINGQSEGSMYGDDVESDQNYPIIRLVNATGTHYARTTNWSNALVSTGATPETVDFTLPADLTVPGNYVLIISGSGITGMPIIVNITAAQIAGL